MEKNTLGVNMSVTPNPKVVKMCARKANVNFSYVKNHICLTPCACKAPFVQCRGTKLKNVQECRTKMRRLWTANANPAIRGLLLRKTRVLECDQGNRSGMAGLHWPEEDLKWRAICSRKESKRILLFVVTSLLHTYWIRALPLKPYKKIDKELAQDDIDDPQPQWLYACEHFFVTVFGLICRHAAQNPRRVPCYVRVRSFSFTSIS